MIPDQIFAALRIATAHTVEYTNKGVFTDGMQVDSPPAAVSAPTGLSLYSAEVEFDGHTAILQGDTQ